jgi:hypothetical protein
MRWAGHVAGMRNRRDAYRVLVQKERCHLEDNSVDGNTVLNWIFKESDGRACFGLTRLRIATNGGLFQKR